VDRRVDIALAIGVVLFGLLMVGVSATAPPPRAVFDPIGPYGFSLVIGTFFLVFGVVLVARQIRALRLGLPPEAVGEGSEDEPGQPASARRAVAIMVATILYTVLLVPLGYIIVSLAFVSGGLALMSERSVKLILLTSIGYTLVSFIVFAIFLRVPLPLGPLNDLFVDIGIVPRVR
jgi:putative tricarboxylic transport membrane protein